MDNVKRENGSEDSLLPLFILTENEDKSRTIEAKSSLIFDPKLFNETQIYSLNTLSISHEKIQIQVAFWLRTSIDLCTFT
ncbi:hypothetical protein ONS95_012368 [Cadophora gregata]|uniref:uncharacterized protein n=1 Tax=Cadophora gregata TaxID=51156 RepID=UPI0026DBE58A|nr:uncharacterized protein ONS95_012368 [Cadophora gregata]KAK0118059.1 hypothetical protein ONS95_012368 [Cadophora gregata]